MNVQEFGRENKRAIVLIHPSLVTWDYFERVWPLLENDYHVVVPVLPGYDLSNDSDFISVERHAEEIANWLLEQGIANVHVLYGCSMGGSIALRMAVDGKLPIEHVVMDGGITPYQLPYIATRFIALRDFLMMVLGKWGGERLMAKAFSSSEYSDDDYAYIANVMRHCSYKTLWNTFDSCNNYRMPKEPLHLAADMHYWYTEKERKARDWDIKYMRKIVPQTRFKAFKGADHGELAFFAPERFAEEIRALGEVSTPSQHG